MQSQQLLEFALVLVPAIVSETSRICMELSEEDTLDIREIVLEQMISEFNSTTDEVTTYKTLKQAIIAIAAKQNKKLERVKSYDSYNDESYKTPTSPRSSLTKSSSSLSHSLSYQNE